jgi:OOP family OmpA-OmpF porin
MNKRETCGIGAAVAALTLVTSTVVAQENDEGLYLGIGYGDFSAKIDEIDDIDDAFADFDEDESAAKYFVGWRLNKYLALQGDYYDLGDTTSILNASPVSTESEGFGASVVGTLPLGPVELFARAGLIFYDLEVSLNFVNEIDESDSDPVYSVGVGLTLFKRLNLQLEYEVIDIDAFDDADAAWINASWRF